MVGRRHHTGRQPRLHLLHQGAQVSLGARVLFKQIPHPGHPLRLQRRPGLLPILTSGLGELHGKIDTRTILDEAITRDVAFMPGEEFYPSQPCLGTMRLNFSHANADEAERGLRVLANLIREHQR